MNCNILGISGYARSGKDTLYKAIKNVAEEHGLKKENIERVAFADSLKEDLDEFLLKNFSISSWTDDNQEKLIIRPILVAYGESKRMVDPEYWLKRGLEKIKDSEVVYVFTDVRYLNEAQALKNLGSINLMISKSGGKAANNTEEENIKKIEDSGVIDFDLNLIDFEEEGLDPIEVMEHSAKKILNRLK